MKNETKSNKNIIMWIILGIAILTSIIIITFGAIITIRVLSNNNINTKAEEKYNIPVRVQYNNSAYVIEGVPETVEVILSGSESQLYLGKQLNNYEVILDLTNYEASNEAVKVELTLNQPLNLDYTINPKYVSVVIKEKVSDIKPISYDLLNQDKLEPTLSVKSIKLSKSDVTVRGTQDTLDEIASIKALIDLNNNDFTKAGSYTVDNLSLIAYSSDGSVIKNVEIVSTNISAIVELKSYSKEVPIKIQTIGNLVPGKAISSITINEKDESNFKTTIYGDEDSIESIKELIVAIDIDGQGNKSSKNYTVTLSKPVGVRSISDESVSVVINFGDAKQRTIKVNNIQMRNLSTVLKANLTSNIGDGIEIQVIGVESIINSINEKSPGITAYVDLAGRTAGTYSIDVMVESNDYKLQYIVTKKVDILISTTK